MLTLRRRSSRLATAIAFLLYLQPLFATGPYTIHVGATRTDIQTVFDGLVCGDTVNFDAGTYDVSIIDGTALTLPDLGCSGPGYTTLQTTGGCPFSRRATAADASSMAILDGSAGTGMNTLQIALGADYYKFDCIGFAQSSGSSFNFVLVGSGGSDQDTEGEIPTHIYFDRILCTAATGITARRCISGNGNDVTLTRSYCAGIKDNADSQCFGATNGWGPFTITDNYLEAAGEDVLFGGGQAFVPNVLPSNITIDNNTITKVPECLYPSLINCKNLIELKVGDTVHIGSNIMSNSYADGQVGQAILLTPRGWAAPGAWTHVKHVTIERNTISNVCQGMQIIGETDGESGDVTLFDSGDFVIQDNLWHINNVVAPECDNTSAQGNGKWMVITLSPDDVTIRRNTVILDRDDYYAITMGQDAASGIPVGFVFDSNIIAWGGAVFLGQGSSGTLGLNTEFGTNQWTWTNNCLGGYGVDSPSTNPTGNGNVAIDTDAHWRALFVDFAGGNYRLIPAGACAGAGADFSLLPGQAASPSTSTMIRLRFKASE